MRRTAFGVVATLSAFALVGAGCSSDRGTASSSGARSRASSAGSDNVSLYDSSVVHDVSVTFDQAAYDRMVDTYVSSREKEWIEATVTIDGVTLERVGMRLKGNSSLRGLARAGGAGGGGGVGGPGGNVSRDAPQSLPWLIDLDKNVEGQSYQGHAELVIRANNSRTSLNEAVALEVTGLAGQATQKAFATRFRVNGGAQVLRLGIEHPNDDWEEATFDGEGILYKAESTGDYSYRGTDPKAYDEVFDQETDKDDENLAPLISFLDFINNSSDAAFAAELSRRLDVEAFARYLALQELIANWDDIDGPGNNSYLRYDEKSKRFTVLSWDLNLAFGTGPGGNGGDAGAQLPPGAFAGARVSPPRPGGRVGGPGGRSNILVQRFQANADFAALVAEARTDLRAKVYASGQANDVLARWTAVLKAHASDLVDAATVDQEAANISRHFTAS